LQSNFRNNTRAIFFTEANIIEDLRGFFIAKSLVKRVIFSLKWQEFFGDIYLLDTQKNNDNEILFKELEINS